MSLVQRYLVIGLVVVGLIAGYALAGVFGGPTPAAAEDPASPSEPPKVITVQGEATIKAKPDTAEIRLGIQTQEPTALAAQEANNQLMNQVIDALKQAGVTEDDLATTQFSIYPVYDHNPEKPGSPPILAAYRVSNILKVRTRNMDGVGKLIDVAARAGANRVDGVSFFIEDTKPYERDGLKEAVKDARTKAELLAAAAGTSIKDVLTITEQGASTYQPPVYYGMERAAADSGLSTPIYSGDQELTVRVTVQFSHQ